MANKFHDNLVVSSSPHMVTNEDTTRIMGTVILALLPALAVGVYQFGVRALILTCVCVVACVVFEYLYNIIMKRPQTVGDLSAALTGLLLALNCPSKLPFSMGNSALPHPRTRDILFNSGIYFTTVTGRFSIRPRISISSVTSPKTTA